jgi:hypothetical protein
MSMFIVHPGCLCCVNGIYAQHVQSISRGKEEANYYDLWASFLVPHSLQISFAFSFIFFKGLELINR